ncbi:MAG: acyl-CoA thioesterase/bile acid-CoA:amino acid N-acyltransferase family protein [Pseudomonadota bacterium]
MPSKTLRIAIFALFGLFFALSLPALADVEVAFDANPSRLGDPVSVSVSGLEPGQTVQVQATRRNDSGDVWYQSNAMFEANDQGQVMPMAQAPISGDWTDSDGYGAFWSMQRHEEVLLDELPEDTVRFRVLDPESDAVLAEADLERAMSFIETEEISLDEAFQGAYIQKPVIHETPLPVVILLGGSEGNDRGSRSMAPYFAARGYAAVGLPYYSPAWGDQEQQFPDLPRGFVDIPVDRMGELIEHLKTIEDLDASRIALFGVSKGAEFVLLAGTRTEGISAIAAIVPTDVVWEGWGGGPGEPPSSFSFDGEALPFVPYDGMQNVFLPDEDPNKITMSEAHQRGRDNNPDRIAAARIPVEEIDVPVFVAGGLKDETWPSGAMAQSIARTRQTAGKPTTALVFADAGHFLSSPPDRPTIAATAAARQEIWPALLAFMAQNLAEGEM